VLGFEPSLNDCLSCGLPVAAGEGARFDTVEGGIRCLRCAPAGHALDPQGLATLRELAGNRIPGQLIGPQMSLLKDFIRVHIAEDIRIRSLDFLAATDD
jgi:recombinational DNA repair protein (RecF pathway)